MYLENKRKVVVLFAAVFMATTVQAMCCIPNQLAVVAGAAADIAALEAYNKSLDKTLKALKSAVALQMAIGVEKQRQIADANALKKSMGIRTDAQTLLIRKKIVAMEAELFSLEAHYNEAINEELKNGGIAK